MIFLFFTRGGFKVETLINLLKRKDVIENFRSVSSCEQGYQIIKQYGYEGSFEDFLDSLSYVLSCVCSCADLFGNSDQLYDFKK